MEVIRTKPKNLQQEDTRLFENEFIIQLQTPSIVELKRVVIDGNIGFAEKVKADVLLSQQANFFKFNFPALCKKIIKLQVTILLGKHAIITDGWSLGYFHWMTDCLPRLLLLKKQYADIRLLLPEKLEKLDYIHESLAMLGEENCRFLQKHHWYFLNKMCFPAHLAPTGNYNDEVMRQLRTIFTQKIASKSTSKVYISRQKSARRKIANEEDVSLFLSKAGFTTIYCEDLSFKEQVTLFSGVKVLVSNHGAGLANMLFMTPQTKVLELRREDDDHNNCYFSLASALDINYYYQNCTAVASADLHNADLLVNTSLLSKNLNLLLADA